MKLSDVFLILILISMIKQYTYQTFQLVVLNYSGELYPELANLKQQITQKFKDSIVKFLHINQFYLLFKQNQSQSSKQIALLLSKNLSPTDPFIKHINESDKSKMKLIIYPGLAVEGFQMAFNKSEIFEKINYLKNSIFNLKSSKSLKLIRSKKLIEPQKNMCINTLGIRVFKSKNKQFNNEMNNIYHKYKKYANVEISQIKEAQEILSKKNKQQILIVSNSDIERALPEIQILKTHQEKIFIVLLTSSLFQKIEKKKQINLITSEISSILHQIQIYLSTLSGSKYSNNQKVMGEYYITSLKHMEDQNCKTSGKSISPTYRIRLNSAKKYIKATTNNSPMKSFLEPNILVFQNGDLLFRKFYEELLHKPMIIHSLPSSIVSKTIILASYSDRKLLLTNINVATTRRNFGFIFYANQLQPDPIIRNPLVDLATDNVDQIRNYLIQQNYKLLPAEKKSPGKKSELASKKDQIKPQQQIILKQQSIIKQIATNQEITDSVKKKYVGFQDQTLPTNSSNKNNQLQSNSLNQMTQTNIKLKFNQNDTFKRRHSKIHQKKEIDSQDPYLLVNNQNSNKKSETDNKKGLTSEQLSRKNLKKVEIKINQKNQRQNYVNQWIVKRDEQGKFITFNKLDIKISETDSKISQSKSSQSNAKSNKSKSRRQSLINEEKDKNKSIQDKIQEIVLKGKGQIPKPIKLKEQFTPKLQKKQIQKSEKQFTFNKRDQSNYQQELKQQHPIVSFQSNLKNSKDIIKQQFKTSIQLPKLQSNQQQFHNNQLILQSKQVLIEERSNERLYKKQKLDLPSSRGYFFDIPISQTRFSIQKQEKHWVVFKKFKFVQFQTMIKNEYLQYQKNKRLNLISKKNIQEGQIRKQELLKPPKLTDKSFQKKESSEQEIKVKENKQFHIEQKMKQKYIPSATLLDISYDIMSFITRKSEIPGFVEKVLQQSIKFSNHTILDQGSSIDQKSIENYKSVNEVKSYKQNQQIKNPELKINQNKVDQNFKQRLQINNIDTKLDSNIKLDDSQISKNVPQKLSKGFKKKTRQPRSTTSIAAPISQDVQAQNLDSQILNDQTKNNLENKKQKISQIMNQQIGSIEQLNSETLKLKEYNMLINGNSQKYNVQNSQFTKYQKKVYLDDNSQKTLGNHSLSTKTDTNSKLYITAQQIPKDKRIQYKNIQNLQQKNIINRFFTNQSINQLHENIQGMQNLSHINNKQQSNFNIVEDKSHIEFKKKLSEHLRISNSIEFSLTSSQPFNILFLVHQKLENQIERISRFCIDTHKMRTYRHNDQLKYITYRDYNLVYLISIDQQKPHFIKDIPNLYLIKRNMQQAQFLQEVRQIKVKTVEELIQISKSLIVKKQVVYQGIVQIISRKLNPIIQQICQNFTQPQYKIHKYYTINQLLTTYKKLQPQNVVILITDQIPQNVDIFKEYPYFTSVVIPKGKYKAHQLKYPQFKWITSDNLKQISKQITEYISQFKVLISKAANILMHKQEQLNYNILMQQDLKQQIQLLSYIPGIKFNLFKLQNLKSSLKNEKINLVIVDNKNYGFIENLLSTKDQMVLFMKQNEVLKTKKQQIIFYHRNPKQIILFIKKLLEEAPVKIKQKMKIFYFSEESDIEPAIQKRYPFRFEFLKFSDYNNLIRKISQFSDDKILLILNINFAKNIPEIKRLKLKQSLKIIIYQKLNKSSVDTYNIPILKNLSELLKEVQKSIN